MVYILSLIAFLMTVASIMGDTWKSRRPTPVGWTILALAAMILLVSIGKHYIDHQEERKISRVAQVQACRAAYQIITPFAILLAGTTLQSTADDNISEHERNELLQKIDTFLRVSVEDELSMQFAAIIDDLPMLLTNTNYLQNTTLGADSPLRPPKSDHTPLEERTPHTWKNIFETTASKGIRRLDTTLTTYRSVLDSGEIGSIQALRNHWLTERMDNLLQYNDSMVLIDFLPLDQTKNKDEAGTFYEQFLGNMKKVFKLCPSLSSIH